MVAVAAQLLASVACVPGGSTPGNRSSPRPPDHARIVNVPGTAIQLTAQQMTATLPDGTLARMWGYCPTASCATTTAWAPGPTIIATTGSAMQIKLTNNLPVPTSLVVLGQLGGGLGSPAMMPSPAHGGQNFSTFVGNADLRPHNCSITTTQSCTADAQCPPPQTCVAVGGPVFNPPAQGQRVKSFGAEVPAATATGSGTLTLSWNNLKAGTYLYETGTLPSLQVPMGLYGVLVVTTPPSTSTSTSVTGTCATSKAICSATAPCVAPDTCILTTTSFNSGTAYPGVSYDADVALLFSELDAVQNAAVDAAARARADVNKRFNDPTCTAATPCYPAAVNYAPTFFLINGKWFDKTAPQNSAYTIADVAASYGTYSSGNVLVRLLNAGSHTHVPTIVGLPMALVAEDGNPAPPVAGHYKVQSEVLLTAGKTHDVLVKPLPASGGKSYAPNTYPVFDRALSLSNGVHHDGGMQAFLLVNHAGAQATVVNGVPIPVPGAPGNLPGTVTPTANPDSFNVPYNPRGCGAGAAPPCTSTSGNVTANDVGIARVALGIAPAHGALTLNPDGSFSFSATMGYSGVDHFTYVGNGIPTLTATVTLNINPSGIGAAPTANPDTYTSSFTTKFSAPRPGVLANDTDPNGYPLIAGSVTGSTCASVALHTDGSFSVTGGGASCRFSYAATNSQGTASAPAQVLVNFGIAGGKAGFLVNAVDATTGVAINDYRWTLQEDLTFKHTVGATPPVNTRTVGTSFHRSHMPVVATGCVGPVSCGSGQSVRGVAITDAQALLLQTKPEEVVLDPTRHYYISIVPGDGANPVITPGPTPPLKPGHTMGGAEVKLVNGAWAPLTVKLEASPLPPAQMSIYLHEDDNPTNGQEEPGEAPLGGFEVILVDPAGRTGDPAGQNTYDAFNMPLSNSLLGRPGCPDTLNAATNGTGTSATGNQVGVIYTCPNPSDGELAAVAAIEDPAARQAAQSALNARYALAGHALVKNVDPGRYDVYAHPGAAREAAGEVWWQTETLEGTPAQDAFVGFNEPVYFQEFGPPGPHVVVGFVNPDHVKAYAHANKLDRGSNTITGKITNQHMSRPSDVTLYDAASYDLLSQTNCRVVLNSQGGKGPAIAAAQCNPDGTFKLTSIPVGVYDLAIFDQWLDQIIQNVAVKVPAPAAGSTSTAVALGDIPVLSWFTQFDQHICLDSNGNGTCDPGEGISNVPLTVRFRNGAPSNRPLTDSTGGAPLAELFPLFNWYVAEADTSRFKQSGVHIIVDGGGKPDTVGPGAGLWSSTYAYPPGAPTERTERPGSLTYGTQGFISQRNTIEWLRTPYAAGENGGITGTVVLASTRPFDDQRFNVQNIWEPLVPRVTMNLYRKVTLPDGTATLKLVDTTATSSWDDFVNLVYGADANQYLLRPDGALVDPVTGKPAPAAAYPPGKQVNISCPGQSPFDPFVNYTLELTGTPGNNPDTNRCYDGFHNWNQVQAAPYDGRYSFPSAAYAAANPLCAPGQISTQASPCTTPAAGQTLVSLPPGVYVVEAVTPAGYEIVKEQDKDILIGDAFIAPVTQQFGALSNIFILPDQATINNANLYNPSTGDPGFQSDPTTNLGVFGLSKGTTFPECVGNLHRVPDYLSMYPQAQQVAPFAGMDRPLCDRKQVVLNDQMQTSASFFVFTYAPVAANNTGIILDDASSEFNGVSPDFGEKASVPFVPVSIKDFAGLEINRTYSDQWGAYNMMTPSSWLVNPPTPSGYGPGMLITCINDPGPIPDPTDSTGKRRITDPQYNPSYSNFCYTNPYMPGQTTYLDTPVLPIAAFAAGYNPVDCALPDQAPVIKRVDGSGFGPWLPATGGILTITAQGDLQVPNPAYAGPFSTDPVAGKLTLNRHYGFGGAKGQLKIGNVDLTGSTTWGDASITVNVPPGTPTGELGITTAAGQTSVDTVTVTVAGPIDPAPTRVTGGAKIQDAIDAAAPGDLILIDAGTYNELLIMWKPVRLQGVGAGSVIINAAKYPNAKLEAWRPRINGLFSVDPVTGNQTLPAQVDPLPTQEITGGVVLLEPTVLGSEEGAGITVLAKNLPADQCANGVMSTYGRPITDSNFRCAPSRIDGLSVTGGDSGGGIYVNGWAHQLEISNNRIYGNAGAYNGGVRVGVPYLELESLPQDQDGNANQGAGRIAGFESSKRAGGRIPGFGFDDHVRIHHNSITKNGTVEAPAGNGGAGGGLSICAGTDNYSVDHNYICGNLSSSDGGGIGHLGFSQNGSIANNQILFNQSFQQSGSTHGGGIAVIGEPPIAGAVSLGTGDLIIDANVLHGNFAEGGQGGGIRLQQVNGADVAAHRNSPSSWHFVLLTNNMIFDNVAGWAGAGISMVDTLNAYIVGNTVASNDSAGIAGVVLAGGVPLPGVPAPGSTVGQGYPSPSGLVSEPTSAQLKAQSRRVNAISQPQILAFNILWQNRSFFYSGATTSRICAGNNTAATGTCNVLPDQGTTGQCVPGAKYWDLGVLGDSSPAPGVLHLDPTFNDMTSTAGYSALNTSVVPPLVDKYCDGSRVVPELPGVINPRSVKNLQVAATVDEGNNYVNLRYGPLYVENPATGGTIGNYSTGPSYPYGAH